MLELERWLGLNGLTFANQRRKGVWGLEICRLSTWRFLLNGCGDSWERRKDCGLGLSNQDTVIYRAGKRGFGLVGEEGAGGWWDKVVALVDGDKGKWFREKLEMKLGDGKEASFWDGRWSGERTIKQRFPRLFQLSKFKNGKVAEMGRWDEGRWEWEVAWRRELFEREKRAVEELISFLGQFTLVEGRKDRWQRGRADGRALMVKDAYRVFSSIDNGTSVAVGKVADFRNIWKSVAPFKAQLMSWRLMWNRLPTIDNLLKLMDIPLQDRYCRGCKSIVETASHFFFQCTESCKLWDQMVDWIGMKWAPPRVMEDHFRVFSDLLGSEEMSFKLGELWICLFR